MKLIDFIKSLFQGHAWAFVILGLVIFCVRIPLPADTFINLPAMLTIFQTSGLMFTIYGLQMIASKVFWPGIKVAELMREVIEGNNAGAAIVLAGLLLFNGLCTIAFATWLMHALGAGISAG